MFAMNADHVCVASTRQVVCMSEPNDNGDRLLTCAARAGAAGPAPAEPRVVSSLWSQQRSSPNGRQRKHRANSGTTAPRNRSEKQRKNRAVALTSARKAGRWTERPNDPPISRQEARTVQNCGLFRRSWMMFHSPGPPRRLPCRPPACSPRRGRTSWPTVTAFGYSHIARACTQCTSLGLP